MKKNKIKLLTKLSLFILLLSPATQVLAVGIDNGNVVVEAPTGNDNNEGNTSQDDNAKTDDDTQTDDNSVVQEKPDVKDEVAEQPTENLTDKTDRNSIVQKDDSIKDVLSDKVVPAADYSQYGFTWDTEDPNTFETSSVTHDTVGDLFYNQLIVQKSGIPHMLKDGDQLDVTAVTTILPAATSSKLSDSYKQSASFATAIPKVGFVNTDGSAIDAGEIKHMHTASILNASDLNDTKPGAATPGDELNNGSGAFSIIYNQAFQNHTVTVPDEFPFIDTDKNTIEAQSYSYSLSNIGVLEPSQFGYYLANDYQYNHIYNTYHIKYKASESTADTETVLGAFNLSEVPTQFAVEFYEPVQYDGIQLSNIDMTVKNESGNDTEDKAMTYNDDNDLQSKKVDYSGTWDYNGSDAVDIYYRINPSDDQTAGDLTDAVKVPDANVNQSTKKFTAQVSASDAYKLKSGENKIVFYAHSRTASQIGESDNKAYFKLNPIPVVNTVNVSPTSMPVNKMSDLAVSGDWTSNSDNALDTITYQIDDQTPATAKLKMDRTQKTGYNFTVAESKLSGLAVGNHKIKVQVKEKGTGNSSVLADSPEGTFAITADETPMVDTVKVSPASMPANAITDATVSGKWTSPSDKTGKVVAYQIDSGSVIEVSSKSSSKNTKSTQRDYNFTITKDKLTGLSVGDHTIRVQIQEDNGDKTSMMSSPTGTLTIDQGQTFNNPTVTSVKVSPDSLVQGTTTDFTVSGTWESHEGQTDGIVYAYQIDDGSAVRTSARSASGNKFSFEILHTVYNQLAIGEHTIRVQIQEKNTDAISNMSTSAVGKFTITDPNPPASPPEVTSVKVSPNSIMQHANTDIHVTGTWKSYNGESDGRVVAYQIDNGSAVPTTTTAANSNKFDIFLAASRVNNLSVGQHTFRVQVKETNTGATSDMASSPTGTFTVTRDTSKDPKVTTVLIDPASVASNDLQDLAVSGNWDSQIGHGGKVVAYKIDDGEPIAVTNKLMKPSVILHNKYAFTIDADKLEGLAIGQHEVRVQVQEDGLNGTSGIISEWDTSAVGTFEITEPVGPDLELPDNLSFAPTTVGNTLQLDSRDQGWDQIKRNNKNKNYQVEQSTAWTDSTNTKSLDSIVSVNGDARDNIFQNAVKVDFTADGNLSWLDSPTSGLLQPINSDNLIGEYSTTLTWSEVNAPQ